MLYVCVLLGSSQARHRLASLVVCSPVTSSYGELGMVPRALTCRPISCLIPESVWGYSLQSQPAVALSYSLVGSN